jgi:hypothetical protein
MRRYHQNDNRYQHHHLHEKHHDHYQYQYHHHHQHDHHVIIIISLGIRQKLLTLSKENCKVKKKQIQKTRIFLNNLFVLSHFLPFK